MISFSLSPIIIAQTGDVGGFPIPLILALVLALIVFGLVTVVVRRYKRCPSNRLLVIYGKTRAGAAKCIHGGAAFIWPVIQDSAFLPLDPFVVPIDLSNALSQENIRVSVPTTMTVAISTQPGIMINAAVRLLGLSTQEIRSKAEDIILGQMRAVIATMRIEEINSDRQAFMGKVNEAVTGELEKVGLAVINTNIKDIDDESGYIKALGKKAAAEAIQQADIDVSEAKRRGEIGVAERERDRRTAVAKARAEAEVGEAQAERERRIQIAEANAEAEVGEGEAARTKRQKLATLNAEAVQTESKAAGDRATYRAGQKVTEEDSRALAEAAARRADGNIQVANQHAQKAAEEARALREEARLKAEITVPAEAERQRVVIAARAEREKAQTIAQGEADARLANAKAEAEGLQAVLDAKAAGYQNLVRALGGGQALGGILLVENIQSLARIQASAIANLPIEKVVVWDGGGDNGGLARIGKQIGGVIPPLHELAKQVGLELPEFLGKLNGGADAVQAPPLPEDEPPAEDEPPTD